MALSNAVMDRIKAFAAKNPAANQGAAGVKPAANPASAVNPVRTQQEIIRRRQEAKGVMPVGTEPQSSAATIRARQEAKGVIPAGTEAQKPYYSRAELENKIQTSQNTMQGLTPQLDARKKEVGAAKLIYSAAEKNVYDLMSRAEQLAQQYSTNPNEETAALYQQVYQEYQGSLRTYGEARLGYERVAASYDQIAQEYNNALAEYQSGEQQLADWRSTVRGADAIRLDLQNIHKEIQQQEQLEKAAALERARVQQMGGLTAGMGAMTQQPYAGYLSPNVSQREVSPQMQRLLDRQSLLQEELQWSDYFAQEAENERQRANARDVRTVQEELDAVKAQLANTQQAEKDAAFAEAGVTPQGMGALMPYGQKLPEQERQGQYNQLRLDRKALQEQEKQLETELYWSNFNRYTPLAEAKDFEDKSRYVSTVNGTQADTLYEMVNKTRERPQEGEGGTGWNDYLREDEIKTFNYLYATEGREAAEGYIDWLKPELTKRQRTGTEERARAVADAHPFLASAESVVLAPARSLAYVVQAFDRANDGEIDENSANYWALHRNSAIRDQVAKNIESSGKWGKAGSFAYQTAMSMADFLYSAAITGGTGWSMAIMGTGAAADTVLAAKDRGLSDGQAFALGTVAGLAEAVTEKVSLDTLLDASLLKDNTLKYVLKNMLAEGSEEVASDVINLMADVLIAQDRSQWQEAIDSYMRDGMNESEAFGQAFKDQMVTMGLDFLGGAISGGVMSGGGIAIDQAQQWWEGRNQGAQQPGVTDIPRATESRTVGEEMTRQIMGKWADNPNPTVTVQPNAKVGKEVVDSAQRIANATGRNVVFYSKAPRGNNIQNGYFHDGVIYINSRSQNPMAQIFSHELTHSTEMADAYQDLSTLVFAQMRAKGANLDQLRKSIRDTYAQEGHPLADDAAVDKEIVADYVARNLLRNEQSIVSLVNENPSLGRKILNWIDKLLAKLGNEDAQARVFLTDARRIYANALGQSHAVAAQTQAEPQTVGEAMTRQIRANHGLEPEATVEVNEAAEEAPLRGLQLPTLEEDAPAESGGQTPEEQRRQLDGQLRNGEITEEEYEGILDLMEAWELEKEAAGEVKHSYSGIRSNAADKNKLEQAEEMRNAGWDNETIRKQTGWFVGMDGKWRFEIDDSQMELAEDISNYMLLGELIRHDALFAAYPDLAEIPVVFQNLGKDHNGSYNHQFDSIDMNRQLMNDPIGLKDALIHEIQHAIQRREGFTRGATAASWEKKKQQGFDSRRAADIRKAQETEQELRRIQEEEPEFYRDMLELDAMTPDLPRGAVNWDTLEKIEDDPIEWQRYDARREQLEEQYGDMKVWDMNDLLYQQKQAEKNIGRSGVELYYDTAGEIEARDVANRRSKSPEQRKSSPPRLGNEDTVFSDSNVAFDYVGDTKDGRRVYQTGFANNLTKADKKKLFKERIATIFNLGAVELKTDVKKIRILGDRFTAQKNLYGDIMAEPGEKQAKVNALYDLADILATSKYIPTATQKEESYKDPTKPPKNAAHKDVKYWYKFKNDIVLDGVPYTVTFNIRDKGSTQYQYLIDFKENKMLGLSNTATKNLLRANQASYNGSVTQNNNTVKQFSVSKTTTETDTEEGTPVVTRQGLNYKARQYLANAERKLLNQLGYKLGVSRMARREDLLPVLQEICDAYLENDTVSNEKVEELFDKAYEAGRVIEREFFDNYKHIKDHLRNTAVTISKQDQSDIADYSDFRKRAFGTLRIVNEGGLPVDTAYQELYGMAPELFPESITHPGDQLQKMYDVAKSIQVSEKTLNEAYGQDARDFYRDEFEQLLGDLVKEMRTVKRYAVDKAPAAEPEEAEEAESLEKIAQVWKNFKQARRATDKAMAKNLLTTSDEEKVGQLLKGKLKLEDLDPETDNVKGITSVYEAKREMEQYYAQLAKFKNRVKATRLSTADHYLETADTWKDKKAGILYARETMARNIYDIVKDRKLAEQIVRHYFTPVQVAQAKATRFKNEYRAKVAALKLDTKVRSGNIVSEAHAVQLYGEAMDNIRMLEKMRFGMNTRDGKNLQEWQAVVRDLWEQNPNLDQSKIQNAVEEFRKIYDELLQKMNEVRMANGYEPVNYRQGYFPHFQPEGDGIAALFGKALGISMGVDTLPTTINGLTHTFKPGIQWFGNAQERLGFNTAYDAVKGFDKYIEGVASVVHQTENIQNLRALATQVRYRTSDEAIRRDVDAIKNDDSKSEEDKRRAIQEIYDKRPCSLSNFVGELDEYTNLLANKKSRFDRQSESDWGRRFYRFMNNISSRVSMNMINGNLSSATTNFIPLTQAMGRIGVRQTLKGMYEAQQAIFRKDASVVEASTFLTNRRGSDPLVKAWNEKVADVLGWPMETIDHFVSESIVRAAYNKNLKDGLSETEALYQADIMAGSIMADRSKGALPTVFERKNFLAKLFTGFQVEVNNQFSEVFKDMPREYAEKSKLALALCLLKYFLAAFLINELEEKVKGRRSALDPIGIGKQFIEDFQKAGIGEASINLIVDTVGSLPFSTLASIGLTQFGFESDSGRVPIQSAIPNLVSLGNAIANDDWSAERRWEAAGEELAKPLTYLASPFGGGNQFAKTIKGLKAYIEGGSYKIEDVVQKDEEGNVISVTGEKAMQYPVFKEDGTMNEFWDVVRASIFGKSALDEAQEWVGSNFKGLTAEQTAVYQDMLDAGVRDRDAFALINEIKGAQKTEDKSRTAVQRELLRKSNVSGDGKALVYYGMILDDDSKERELMDRMADNGADMWEVSSVLMDIHDTEEGKTGKLTRVMNSRISAEEKAAFVEYVMGSDLETEAGRPSQYAKFLYSLENGMSVDEYLEVYTGGGNVDQYLEMMYEGVDHDAAQYYAEEVEDLVPLDAKGNVSDIQKWRVAIDASQNEEQQMTMLYILMKDSQYQNVEIAHTYGVSPEAYVRLQELLPEYDLDHSGGYKQTEIQAAINGLAQETKLTDTEKAALWQLVTGSTSSKKNPFGKKVGQKIIDEKKAAKDAPEEETDDISFADAVMQQLLGR